MKGKLAEVPNSNNANYIENRKQKTVKSLCNLVNEIEFRTI